MQPTVEPLLTAVNWLWGWRATWRSFIRSPPAMVTDELAGSTVADL